MLFCFSYRHLWSFYRFRKVCSTLSLQAYPISATVTNSYTERGLEEKYETHCVYSLSSRSFLKPGREETASR